jgi:uncharacterized protein YbbC (DUF1343 family)
VEGPMLDANLHSNVGCYDLPVRHGMTLGEIASMANAERKWNAKLEVIRMENWRRDEWFDSTGLNWVDPSPNMRSLSAATLYPGVSLLEAMKDYSVGRGTDAPLEQIGAAWINGAQLATHLNARAIPGIRAYPVAFQPSSSIAAGKRIEGVRFVVVDRDRFDAVGFGLEVAAALRALYPAKVDFESSKNLIGNRVAIDALKMGQDPKALEAQIESSLAPFLARRARFLLY